MSAIVKAGPKVSGWDRFLINLFPTWGLERIKARTIADRLDEVRNYEAASRGRRTQGWARTTGDADAVSGIAQIELRMHTRDLIRNNGWARKAQRTVANHTVGWGIMAKATGPDATANKVADELWRKWAGKTRCSAEGRHTFGGLQHLAMRSLFESGEVLIRRRPRRPSDGLPIPLQIQLLESDFLDHSQNALKGMAGGPIVRGVEYDMIGRRAAYWLFESHPGAGRLTTPSRRIPATEVLHIYDEERIGQSRGISWLGAGIVNLKDLDAYDDAELVAKKIAACFAGFITDDGLGGAVGIETVNPQGSSLPPIESFEPGMVVQLPTGKKIEFGNPPPASGDALPMRTLRRIAAAALVTYEDLTGDYTGLNFSSARMSRLAHWGNVYQWQENMMIPLMLDPVWDWAMEAAATAGLIPAEYPDADWICPAMPSLDPEKEALGLKRMVRSGFKSLSDAIREQGVDPEAHFAELAKDKETVDKLGLVLDSDAAAVSDAGLTQQRAGVGGNAPAPAEDPPKEKKPAAREGYEGWDDADPELDITDEDFKE